ncbi:MAG: caspase domain-containing protein [Rhodospirillales bacterium]
MLMRTIVAAATAAWLAWVPDIALAQSEGRGLRVERQPSGPQRIALVIGNGAYAEDPLRNPPADARLIAATLREVGFDVTEKVDLTQNQMKLAIVDFGERLDRAGDDAVGLFYYAGHGVQVQGQNYLVPIDAQIRREAEVEVMGVDAHWVLRQMEYAKNAINLVILDACRNVPRLTRSFRAPSAGLARMDAPQGTLIAYATRPGEIAADGSGANSPYSAALARGMRRAGQPLTDMFIDVRRSVIDATGGRQVPWEEGGLTANFYFLPAAAAAAAAPRTAAAAPAPVPVADLEAEAWSLVRDSGSVAGLEEYLRQFPQGRNAGLARILIAELRHPGPPRAAQPPAAVAPPAPTAAPPATQTAALPSAAGTIDADALAALLRGAQAVRVATPPDLRIQPPPAGTPQPLAQWLGVWGPSRPLHHNGQQLVLAVEAVTPEGRARVVHAWGPVDRFGMVETPGWLRADAAITDDELSFTLRNGTRFVYALQPGNRIYGTWYTQQGAYGSIFLEHGVRMVGR